MKTSYIIKKYIDNDFVDFITIESNDVELILDVFDIVRRRFPEVETFIERINMNETEKCSLCSSKAIVYGDDKDLAINDLLYRCPNETCVFSKNWYRLDNWEDIQFAINKKLKK